MVAAWNRNSSAMVDNFEETYLIEPLKYNEQSILNSIARKYGLFENDLIKSGSSSSTVNWEKSWVSSNSFNFTFLEMAAYIVLILLKRISFVKHESLSSL